MNIFSECPVATDVGTTSSFDVVDNYVSDLQDEHKNWGKVILTKVNNSCHIIFIPLFHIIERLRSRILSGSCTNFFVLFRTVVLLP